jgi:hypothetical protein
MITDTEGCLRIEPAEGTETIEAGDFAISSSAQACSYVNDGEALSASSAKS